MKKEKSTDALSQSTPEDQAGDVTVVDASVVDRSPPRDADADEKKDDKVDKKYCCSFKFKITKSGRAYVHCSEVDFHEIKN